ncbi:hypothetical protein [Shimia sp.]|uniref:hypothetical protein n=1 Tax=Shimia sp. TaxID=1954381 RepID=UPI00329A3914
MSLEQALAELTEAVKENTAQHAAFAEVAKKVATGKSSGEKAADTAESDAEKAKADAAAKKKADAAAKRKAAAAKKKAEAEAKAQEESEADVVTEISVVDLRALAKEFMSSDEAEERDAAKARFGSALEHLGAEKLSEVDTDEDRAKLATYIKAWQAGEEDDDSAFFEALDEKVGGGSDDDMLD